MSFYHKMRDAMYERGLPYSGSIKQYPDKYHVFTSENDECKDKCCRYRIFTNELGAHFVCWRRDINLYWFPREYKTFTPIEKAQFSQERERAKKLQLEQQQEALKSARKDWSQAKPINLNHQYVIKKSIIPIYAKQKSSNILLPIYNSKGQIISTQEIYPDGMKRFAKGASMSGGMLFLGEHVTPIIRICEGWATGCSIHEAVGETVIVSFSGNNLENVAIEIHRLCPKSKLLICGDTGDAGIKYAERAVKATNSKSVYPKININGKDFNDLHQLEGIEELRKQLGEGD